jgi:hypothetical protein
MRHLPRLWIRRLFLALLALLIASSGLFVWLLWPTSAWARASELAAAERRWALRPFGSYHLELVDKTCTQKIDVRNERVVKVAPNRCEVPPRSISDLFELIRRDGSISQECIFHGCICDDVIRVNAVYDSSLGFPSRIIVRLRAEPNWRHPEFWEAAWARKRLPSCDGMAEGSKLIRIIKIVPD